MDIGPASFEILPMQKEFFALGFRQFFSIDELTVKLEVGVNLDGSCA